MRILLDTHIFLWCTNNDRKLSKKARNLIEKAEDVYVSSASIWEVAIKNKLGKIKIDINDLINAITESGFSELPINVRHAAEINELPPYHRDPFDRILVAQAISEPLKLLTADKALARYSELVEIV